MRCVASALALLALVSAATPRGATAQQDLWERGNQLYQAGDFNEALGAYRSVLEAGYQSAELQYNLGNAYYKTGDLGRAILSWERALRLRPGDEDALANLELARSLTADDIEPLPRFWLLSVVDWWVNLLPRRLLWWGVAFGWLALAATWTARIISRDPTGRGRLGVAAVGAAILVLVLGANLLVREAGLGRTQRGIVLAQVVPVRSAPDDDDDLTLFEVHEGTRVRIDQRAGGWAEVVLDDGKVGWVPVEAFEVI